MQRLANKIALVTGASKGIGVLVQITNGKQTRASLGLFLTLRGQPPRLGELGLQESRGWRGQIGVS